jgi:hypothetical protein
MSLKIDLHNEFLIRGFFNHNCPESSRGKLPINEKSMMECFDDVYMNNVSIRTISGNSKVRLESGNFNSNLFLSSLKKINEMEIIKLGNLLCQKCLSHCKSQIHLFGGALKNHILTKAEMKQLIRQENIKDLHQIINSLKSKVF